MRVLVLGATGYIGFPIVQELLSAGHDVVALVRSDKGSERLGSIGAETVRGDIQSPQPWLPVLGGVDAVVHAAATFTDDMGAVDRHLVETIIDGTSRFPHRIRFLYTGGCWLYGRTGDAVATEESGMNPIASFRWMVENAGLLMAAPHVDTIVVHPAMVYDRDGGAIARYLESADSAGRVEIWGSRDTRWPVVHKADLAKAYLLALQRGEPGRRYNIAAQEGVFVGDIADAISERMGLSEAPLVMLSEEILMRESEWSDGPMLDQQMSAALAHEHLDWRPQYTDILVEIS